MLFVVALLIQELRIVGRARAARQSRRRCADPATGKAIYATLRLLTNENK